MWKFCLINDKDYSINQYGKDYNVKLAYKMAGFSDKKYLKVLAEQSSPNSTANSVLLPDENYDVVLYKSTPTRD